MSIGEIFNGIGTQIIIYILGVISGVIGCKVYQNSSNKQSQRAGNGAIQIQNNHSSFTKDREEGTIAVQEGQQLSVGDYVNGNKIVSSEPDEFDIRNFSRYSNTQIEGIVIARGNNATLRAWCLELILNHRQDYLIRQCVEKMENDKEKYRLLEELAKRGFADSEYFTLLGNSLTNALYMTKTIKLCLTINKIDYVESIFNTLCNNQYIFNSLVEVYGYNKNLFKKLYDNGNCFTNKTYMAKMGNWLDNQ